MTTRPRLTLEPRSTKIHCGSEPSALAQRVAPLPSTALGPVNVDVSMEEAVTGRVRARLTLWADAGKAASHNPALRASRPTPRAVFKRTIHLQAGTALGREFRGRPWIRS